MIPLEIIVHKEEIKVMRTRYRIVTTGEILNYALRRETTHVESTIRIPQIV